MARMEVDRIMHFINEDLIEHDGRESASIHPDSLPTASPPDLHPWCIEDVINVHSLLPAEDPVPIPSVEEIKERMAGREADVSTTSPSDGGHDPESEYDTVSRIYSLGWTRLHTSHTGRTIDCRPLPPLANLFGSTMKETQDDFNAQGFEMEHCGGNDKVMVIHFVAQPWSEADDSTIIGSPIATSTTSSSNSPSSGYHLPYEYDDTPDSPAAHSTPILAPVDAEGDSPATQVEQEYSPSEKSEPQHLKAIDLTSTTHHEEVVIDSVAPRCATEPYPPSPPPGVPMSCLLPVPPQPTGVAPYETGNFVDDTVTGPPITVFPKTVRDPARSEEPPEQRPSISYFDPGTASTNFFGHQPPHIGDTASRDRIQEIVDSQITYDPKGPSYKCPCGQSFSRKNDVKRHIRLSSKHKAERWGDGRLVVNENVKCTCKYCGEVLSRPDACKRHEKVKACGKRAIRQLHGYTPLTEATKCNW